MSQELSFPARGEKNGIWLVLCVNPRTFDRSVWPQIKELRDYLCVLCLPQLEHSRKRAPDFTIHNFSFMQH